MQRMTQNEIKELAFSHVAYKWARSPGTNRRDVLWTNEDTQEYNKWFDYAYKGGDVE